jgi:hypothetical protein
MSIARHVGFIRPLASALVLAAILPTKAQAQAEQGPSKADRAAARDAYDKGTKSFEKGDYVTALDSFVKANALIPSVQAMYWIAQAQDKMGRTELAIEAYEAVMARADFSKLSDDKEATVRERLAALKAQRQPPAPAAAEAAPAGSTPELPPAEPAPQVSALPAAQLSLSTAPPPPLHSDDDDVLPERNTAELGVLGGALVVSDSHNLVGAGQQHRAFQAPVWEVGVRAAFFPEKVFGIEAEWAHGFGKEADLNGASGSNANFDVVRGHLIGQLPTSRLVPFALLGGGMIHGSSDQNGSDTDFLLQAGAGIKVMATPLLVPRLDVRLNLTQKEGGRFTDGVSAHPEVLLGLGFTLGR